jgi:hypothetical protein
MKLYLFVFRYWGWEAIGEWLKSINKYMYNLQISSLRKARYINLIMDETRDITTKEMLCLCLRYVEEDTGRIQEQVFMLKPIMNQSGEGKQLYQVFTYTISLFRA